MNQTQLPCQYRRNMLDRFLRYVRVQTTSKENAEADQCPSTPGQLTLADELVPELHRLGLTDVFRDDNGYVYATLPSNCAGPVPVIGLMSHLDTSEQASGTDVVPRIIACYDGQDIDYPDDKDLVLKVGDNPDLKKCVGHELVTASGKTLLGADDKAGIAEIMTILEYLIVENVPHGELRICFNPDEEIGRGTAKIDIKRFRPDFAITMDGGELGEIESECFNAATATVTVKGVNVHPGMAKGKLVDAALLMAQIMTSLQHSTRPENTEDREPYVFPYKFDLVTTEECRFQVLLRSFDLEGLWRMEEELRTVCSFVSRGHPAAKVEVTVEQKYRNMKAVLDQHPKVMELLGKACEIQGIVPINKPIRGGTDGSALSIAHNIPTPNIWAGGMNMHSRLEWVSVTWMVRAVETMLTMIGLYAEHATQAQTA